MGAVLPATSEPVVLKATVDGGEVEGQVAVQNSAAPDPRASRSSRRTRRRRRPSPTPSRGPTRSCWRPGSLFTSLLPALAAADVHAALAAAAAPIVAVVNLVAQPPETLGLDVADHLRAVLDTGVRVDRVVVDPRGSLPLDPAALAALGVECTMAAGRPTRRRGPRTGQTGVGARGSASVLSRLDEPISKIWDIRAVAPAGTGQRRPGMEGS